MAAKPNIISVISQNEYQVPAHNANTHQFLAIHYLGVNGENPNLFNGGYGGHFYVSKDGQCYQAALVTDLLWHVGASSGFTYKHSYARNGNTIGIECATYSSNGEWFFTEATQRACAQLAAWIMDTYNIPMSNLLRHGDITTKHCPSPYIDNPGQGGNWTWNQFKQAVAVYRGQTSSNTSTSSSTTTWKAIRTAICTDSPVNVRYTPGGNIIGQLGRGNRFEVDGKISGDWVHIKVAGIGIGWIHKDYVLYDYEEAAAAKKTSGWKAIGTATSKANDVNVRSTPTDKISTNKIGKLNKGNRVEYNGETKDGWRKVKVAKIGIGWVHGQWLKND